MPNVCLLDIRNNGGSVEHYYHFLLGYLLPLCAYAEQRDDDGTILLARGCGPLSRIVREVEIPGLILCERQSHSMLLQGAEETGGQTIELFGLDCSPDLRNYDPDQFAEIAARATRYIRRRLGRRIDALREELEANWLSTPRVMVIRRENPDPYYFSELAETKGGGITRRFIANVDELIAALNAGFEQTSTVSLEHQPLAEQIALFQTADIVVAQHGAALSNVIWMRPDTHVFEFLHNSADHIYYQDLSSIFGVKHHLLAQETQSSSVDVDALMNAITSNLS